MLSKSSIAITLSKLESFKERNIKLEQYESPSEVVAEIVWTAYMLKDIQGKTILDAGTGTGLFTIASLLLGAKRVYSVDVDKNALEVCKNNLDKLDLKSEIINKDISKFDKTTDVVIQNPPFGTKEKHADKVFLEKAFKTAKIVYSLHKSTTKKFVESIARDNNYKITHIWEFNFELKKTQKFHKKRIHRIEVSCFRMEKQSKNP